MSILIHLSVQTGNSLPACCEFHFALLFKIKPPVIISTCSENRNEIKTRKDWLYFGTELFDWANVTLLLVLLLTHCCLHLSVQKFKEFLNGSNLIIKLQAKHDLLKQTLGEGKESLHLIFIWCLWCLLMLCAWPGVSSCHYEPQSPDTSL